MSSLIINPYRFASGGGGGGTPGNLIDSYTISGTYNNSFHFGTRFTVGASDLTVTGARGMIQNGFAGTVYLWRVSDEALLDSVDFTGAGKDIWVDTDLGSPIILPAGADYIVSHYAAGATRQNYPVNVSDTTFNPAITFVQGNYQTSDAYPGLYNTDASYSAVDLIFTV